MIAVFLTPEAFQDVLKNVQGDANEQNVGDALKEMYECELREVVDYTRVGNPYEGYSVDNNDGVIACAIDGSDNRWLGRAIAGNLGFIRDFCKEDSWYGVLFL